MSEEKTWYKIKWDEKPEELEVILEDDEFRVSYMGRDRIGLEMADGEDIYGVKRWKWMGPEPGTQATGVYKLLRELALALRAALVVRDQEVEEKVAEILMEARDVMPRE